MGVSVATRPSLNLTHEILLERGSKVLNSAQIRPLDEVVPFQLLLDFVNDCSSKL